ncbi:MAG: 2OG-Fe(II) oxygenase [Sulfurimonas sp.]
MIQISNYIYGDARLEELAITNRLLPSPYKDTPYLIIKNFFTSALCTQLVSLVQEKEESRKAEVKLETMNGIIEADVVPEYRKTNIYTLDDFYSEYYEKQFLKYKPVIEEYFAAAMTLSTDIQVLEYKEGYFYIKHADDSSALLDEQGETVGFKCVAPERKLTTVLFATSHLDHVQDERVSFSGGELLFNYLYHQNGEPVKIKAEAGDMVVFPSNPYFSHEVLPVKKGYRLTLVQWHDAIY